MLSLAADPFDLTSFLDRAPVFGQGLLGVGIVVGLVLWLIGRRIARPVCAVCGLLCGGLAAAFVARQWTNPAVQLGTVVGGGVVGCLGAVLLFRIWMGLTCAAVLALVVPLACLIWSGETIPAGADNANDLSINRDTDHVARDEDAQDNPPEGSALGPGLTGLADVAEALQRRLSDLYQKVENDLRARWQAIGSDGRRTVYVGAGIGVLVGLLGGLIFPKIAASFQSALVGASLVLASASELIRIHVDSSPTWWPSRPDVMLMLTGLITLLGVLLQWTFFRRKADG